VRQRANSQMIRHNDMATVQIKASALNMRSIRRGRRRAGSRPRVLVPIIVVQLLHIPGQCAHGCGCATPGTVGGAAGLVGGPLAPRWSPTDASAQSLDEW
jgi:hypothetical protein